MCDMLRAPWRVERCRRYTGLYDVYDHDENTIAEWKTKEVAILIATAPKLLAALEGILAVVNVRIDDPRCAAFDAARAAIAEATAKEATE